MSIFVATCKSVSRKRRKKVLEMTLDEAIKHCEEVANRERELYSMCPEACDGSSDCRELKHGKDKGCLKCAEEHEQLAGWLKELAEYQKLFDSPKEAEEVLNMMSV